MTLAGNTSLTIREKNCNYFAAHTYTTGHNIGSPGGHGFESRQVHTVNTVHGTMTLAGNSSLTIREKNCNYFAAHTYTV